MNIEQKNILKKQIERKRIKDINRSYSFTLEKCIMKYGQEDGFNRWQNRQEKWQKTLMSKSPEEIAEINKKKIANSIGFINKSFFKKYPELKYIEYGLYLIYFRINGENFIKVGLTKLNLKDRFSAKKLINSEILFFKKGEFYKMFNIEQSTINNFKKYKYVPQIFSTREAFIPNIKDDLIKYVNDLYFKEINEENKNII